MELIEVSKERLLIATFYNPKLDGAMGHVTPHSPARFKRIGVANYFKGLLARELYTKSYLDVLRNEVYNPRLYLDRLIVTFYLVMSRKVQL